MSRLTRVRTRGAALATRAWRRLPLTAAARFRIGRRLVWRSRPMQVPVDRILVGGQNGLGAAEYGAAAGDLLWASRRVTDGPHAELLRLGRDGAPDDEVILRSSYADMARTCIQATGHYFGATDDDGIVQVARDFVERARGAGTDTRRAAQSDPGSPILLAPIRASDCWQVVDGHHRLAIAAESGADMATATVRRTSVSTPLQDLLDRMSWIGGSRELYQPLDAPELEMSWTTVRRCTDRLDAMEKLLRNEGLWWPGATYLDVACCYGWFVAEMSQRGFTAQGVERDPLARELGPAAYGLDPDQIVTSDVVDFLRPDPGRWDVVSCFSLLHHFVLGRGSVDAGELLRLLDRATGRVLLIDTGQAHEEWFRRSLPEWTTEHVAEFLEKHGTFDRVVDLGPDQDAVPPYEKNYGRHLFACIRD